MRESFIFLKRSPPTHTRTEDHVPVILASSRIQDSFSSKPVLIYLCDLTYNAFMNNMLAPMSHFLNVSLLLCITLSTKINCPFSYWRKY